MVHFPGGIMKQIRVFLAGLLAGWAFSAASAEYSWEVVPIVPECESGVFCEREEVPLQLEKAGIVKRIENMIDRAVENNGQISLAFMSFTEPALYEALCRAGRKGIAIEGFFHGKAGPPKGLAYRLETNCQGGPRRKNVKMHYMGMPVSGKSGWRLHHNKYFLVETEKEVEIGFGSANLSTQGLSVNFENWNFVSGPKTTPFIQDYLCNVQAMRKARKAGRAEDDPKVFRKTLDSCLTTAELTPEAVDRVLEEEGLVALFAPDAKDRNFTVLADQIRRVRDGGRIRMAVYFFMHKPIIDELIAARKRGVQVELLVDDDIYSGGSIPTQKRIWDAHLKPEKSGFKVRAFDTNEALFQLQHNKYVIFEDVDYPGRVRVFGGAGQFTVSAFKVNYENFFLAENPVIVEPYQELFDRLWSMASDVSSH